MLRHILLLTAALASSASGGNPILKKADPNFLYAADPSAEVFNGKVYVYCSHDQDDAQGYSSMQDYVILESSDLKHWTNHGVVLEPRTAAGFEYATGQMNAPDCAYKDGWYYWYFPYEKTYVGVAKSQSPTGPWETAIEGSLAEGTNAAITAIFDPTVFVDDDGQAYIYGNDAKVGIGDPGAHVMGAKLKDNMVELDSPWYRLSEETVSEAVTVFKRNGVYYFMARKAWDETYYFMADNALPNPDIPENPVHPSNPATPVHNDPTTGYATLMGSITNSANNAVNAPSHMSAIEFNGEWYFFYHRGDVNDGTGHRRSACVDKMIFNPDGTIQNIEFTLENPAQITKEAEDFLTQSGISTNANPNRSWETQIEGIQHGDWACYDNINFGGDATAEVPFYFRAASNHADGGTIEMRLDSPTGTIIHTLDIPHTGTGTVYETFETAVTGVTGVHPVYLTFSGGSGDLMVLNWFSWTPASPGDSMGTRKVEGELFDDQSGNHDPALAVTIENSADDDTQQVAYIHNGDWVSYQNIDFGPDPTANVPFFVRASAQNGGGDINLRLDSADGEIIGTVTVTNTGGWTSYETFSTYLSGISGEHTLYLTFSSTATLPLMNLNWFSWTPSEDTSAGPDDTPFREAEDFTDQYGIAVEETSDPEGGTDEVALIQNGDWTLYTNVYFGDDPSATIPFFVRTSSNTSGGDIELRLDDPASDPIGTVTTTGTGSWDTYQTFETSLTGVSGTHSLYLTFTGGAGYLLNLNWFSWTVPAAAVPEPLAHWNMDEGSGSVVSDSANGHDGTLVNALWVVAPDGGRALHFNGTDATVQLPATAFASLSDEVTISFWAHGGTTQPINNSVLRASIYEGETEKRILNIHLPWGDGTVFWDAGNSTGYDRISKVATGSEISGTWNHWVFTKDSVAGTMAIYLNGALWIDQSDGTPSRTIGAPTDVTLGSGHGELYFDGSIDDLRLFDTALSASQIESLYQKPALYRNWVAASGLTGSDAATNANPDFDTLPNLAEYALGGNPLGTDVPEIHPDVAMPLDAPTVEYTYRRRIDSEARGLTYIVETTTDLANPESWTTEGVTETNIAPYDSEFELVTVAVSKGNVGFIRLKIQMD